LGPKGAFQASLLEAFVPAFPLEAEISAPTGLFSFQINFSSAWEGADKPHHLTLRLFLTAGQAGAEGYMPGFWGQ